MCTFVMVALPKGKIEVELLRVLPRWAYPVPDVVTGPSRRIPVGYELFGLVGGPGGCSCGFIFDPESPEELAAVETERLLKLRKSYRKRGWSEAKMERAIDDSHRASGSSGVAERAHLQDLEELERCLGQAAAQIEGGLYLWWHDVDAPPYEPARVPLKRRAAALQLRPSKHPMEAMIHYV